MNKIWIILCLVVVLASISGIFGYSASASDSSVYKKENMSIDIKNTDEIFVKNVHRVTLITGDVILVGLGENGKNELNILPADHGSSKGFRIIESPKGTYIFPEGIDLRKLDKELFNIDYLIEESYYNQTDLPVLIDYVETKRERRVDILELRERFENKADMTVLKSYRSIPTFSAKISYKGINKTFKVLTERPDVKKIWLDKKVKITLYESVPLTGATELWESGYNGSGMEIAILDTGIDDTHPDLDDLDDNPSTNDPKVVRKEDFTDDNMTGDLYGHGTHCAGIAAGTGNASTLVSMCMPTPVSTSTLALPSFAHGDYFEHPRESIAYTVAGTDDEPAHIPYKSSLQEYAEHEHLHFEQDVKNMDHSIEETPPDPYEPDNDHTQANWIPTNGSKQIHDFQAFPRYIGVAPSAELWNIKVLNQYGDGYDSWIIDGIEYAAYGPDEIPNTGDEADIISMSLGGGPTDGTDPLSQAVNDAVDHGLVVVVAAGNSGTDYFTVSSPGAASDVITVGASTKYDGLAGFSSWGPTLDMRVKPDVLAPGVGIIAPRANGTSMGYPINEYYTEASGTSVAAPHVAGAAALMLQAHTDWNPEDVKNALISTADDLGYTVYKQGGGRMYIPSAVNTKILVDPATISFVNSSDKTITFRNIDTASHTITLDAVVYDALTDTEVGCASLNRTSVNIASGSSVSVLLTIDTTSLPKSMYSGKVIANIDSGEQIHAIFGFSNLNEVRVNKINMIGCPASYDLVIVFSDTEDGWIVDGITDENGTVVFRLPNGMYNIISGGGDIPGAPVYTVKENISVEADMNITLDERDAKIIDFDCNKAEQIMSEKYDEVHYHGEYIGVSFSGLRGYPDETKTYITPTSSFESIFVYSYYPEAYYNESDRWLINTPGWHKVLYNLSSVTENVTFVVDYGDLVERTIDYKVALEPELASWWYPAWHPDMWSSATYICRMNAPQSRVEWLSPEPISYFGGYEQYTEWWNGTYPDWNYYTDQKYPAGTKTYFALDEHPLKSGAEIYVESGYLEICAYISEDIFENKFANYSCDVSGNLTVIKDGETIMDHESIRDYFRECVYFSGMPRFDVIIHGNSSPNLSTCTKTELGFIADPTGDYRPPNITINVVGSDLYNCVTGGDVKLNLTVNDETSISSVDLKYSIDDGSTWDEASLMQINGNEWMANIVDLNDSYVSIMANATDSIGNSISQTVIKGFYVSAAEECTPPNRSWNITISAANQLEPVTVGMHPNASDGYDAFDVFAQTLVQGEVILLLDDIYSKSIKQTRCYNESASWNLSVGVPSGQTTTLSWNIPSNVNLTIHEGDTILNSGVQLSEGNHSLSVIAELLEKQTFSLNPNADWNMISLPLVPDNCSVYAIFGIPTLDSVPVVMWASPSFVPVVCVEPKIGYWVFTPVDMAINVTGTPITDTPLNLKAGWNMVGTVGVDNLTISDIPNQVPERPPVTGVPPSFVETDVIEPGKSAWVFVTADTITEMDRDVLTKTKSKTLQMGVKTTVARTVSKTLANEWNLTISATNQLEPATFGIHPNATNGYDDYNVFSRTPVQGKVILILDDIYATSVNRDKLTWNLSVGVPDGEIAVLTWNSSRIPGGIVLTLDGIDMKLQDSMELGGGSHSFVINATLPVLGDVNHDGMLSTVDAVLVLQMASGSIDVDPAADVSGDGRVTSLDALMILQAAADNIEIG